MESGGGSSLLPPPTGFSSLGPEHYAKIIGALYAPEHASERKQSAPEAAILPLRLVSRGFRHEVDRLLRTFFCYIKNASGTLKLKGSASEANHVQSVTGFFQKSLPRWANLTSLCLTFHHGHGLMDTLESLEEGCPQLRELSLRLIPREWHASFDRGLWPLCDMEELEALTLSNCGGTHFQEVCCDLPTIRRLTLTGHISDKRFLRLAERPALEELAIDAEYEAYFHDDAYGRLYEVDIASLQASTKLRSVKLRRVKLLSLELPPTLETLALVEIEHSKSVHDYRVLETPTFPMLRSLHIEDVCTYNRPEDVQLHLGGCPSLPHLHVRDFPPLEGLSQLKQLRVLKLCFVHFDRVPGSFFGDLGCLSSLETLEIQSCSQLGTDLPALPSLQQLHLRYLHTSFSLPLLDSMPCLKSLSIIGCEKLEPPTCGSSTSPLLSLRLTKSFQHPSDLPLSLVLHATTGLRELELQWTHDEALASHITALTRLETLAIMPTGPSFTLPDLSPVVSLKKLTIRGSKKLVMLNLESLLELRGQSISLTLSDLSAGLLPDLGGVPASALLLYNVEEDAVVEGLPSLRRLSLGGVGQARGLTILGCPNLEEVAGAMTQLVFVDCPRLRRVCPAVSVDQEAIGFEW